MHGVQVRSLEVWNSHIRLYNYALLSATLFDKLYTEGVVLNKDQMLQCRPKPWEFQIPNAGRWCFCDACAAPHTHQSH